MAKSKVLIIEDDRDLSDALSYNLGQNDYDVACAFDGRDGLNLALRQIPDVIILDVMLPTMDGIDVCKQLRANSSTSSTIIIMLTAKSEESDQLIGFSVGADDYVVKPFSVKVLLQRIKALRRRKESDPEKEATISSQGIVIDRVKHQVMVNGERIDLTPTEFRLLEMLVNQPGRAFERAELMDAALGESTVVLERTIDVHVRALRKKMGEAGSLIETVRGIGYRFHDERA